MKKLVMLAAVMLIPVFSRSQNTSSHRAYWQQDVRYQIEATLDTTAKSLHSHLVLTYKNNSPDTLKKIYLQVPANAFFDEENTAVREMRRFQSDNVRIIQENDYPLTIQSVQFQAVGRETEFPLRAYDFHDTLLDLPLPANLPPGDSLILDLNYVQDYKKAFARPTADNLRDNRRNKTWSPEELQIDFVHWYPRVAVYDPAKRGWNAEPFHFLMEAQSVYSEFAAIEATITVPRSYIIVGSGEVVEGDPGWNAVTVDTTINGKKFIAWHDSVRQQLKKSASRRVRFRAARATNFIWSLSPAFVKTTFFAPFAVNVFGRGQAQQNFAKTVAKNLHGVLRYLQNNAGEYPFSQLNIVMAGQRDTSQPPMILLDDGDVFSLVFALGRAYFPGIVGSNGVAESWMANGLALFFAKDFSEKKHGKLGYDADSVRKDLGVFAKLYPLPSINELLRNFTRMYMSSGQNEPIANAVHQYKDPSGMFFNAFMKADLLYEMLRYVVGDSAFTQILQRYYGEWKFKHASEKDFVEICERISGQDLEWFFNQWLHQTPTVDYQKGEITKKQRADGAWVTEVEIKRKGDGIMPVEVELERGDGQKEMKRWDGKSESGKVVFETPEKPGRIVVDPNDEIMDNNLLNNGRRRLEFKPDLPFMRYVFMPGDAYVVLWRPELDYNSIDGFRLGMRTQTSYRAFYNNLTLQFDYGFLSKTLDGMIGYSHPLRRGNLRNRYAISARKAEGRFEADARLRFQALHSLTPVSEAEWQIGLNYSDLLNRDYTFRTVANDTGKVKLQEWDDRKILLAYLQANARFGRRRFSGETQWRVESALPSSESRFTKISGKLAARYRLPGLWARVQGNAGTSLGPDRLPLQDLFHGEGADARTRFRSDKLKTFGEWTGGAHRLVEGGGNLRGYTGTPLLAEKYATFNLEIGPTFNIAGLSPFLFYDRGVLYRTRGAESLTRANAGAALNFGGSQARWFGVNFLSEFSFRIYFPFWLSHPLPGEKQRQYRWYFALGKAL
jgi:hypothetical protein